VYVFSGMGRLRLLGLAVAAALLAAASGTMAAPSMPLLVLVANRTSSGATSFDMQFGVTYRTGGGAFFGDFGVHLSGRQVVSMVPDGMTTFCCATLFNRSPGAIPFDCIAAWSIAMVICRCFPP